jgi:YggT family protein
MMIRHLLGYLLEIYLLLLIARALLSWFQASRSGVVMTLSVVLAAITEPVLRPIRKVIPPVRIGGTQLDLSIMVIFIVVQFLILPILLR